MLAKLFKGKGLRFYLEIGAGLIAIITSIIFFAMDRQLLGDNDSFQDISHFTLIFLIAGGLVAIADAFFPLPGLGIVSAVLFGCGIGNHLRLACYPLADINEEVPFFTKDVNLAHAAVRLFITFLVIFAILAIAIVISNFLSPKKKEA